MGQIVAGESSSTLFIVREGFLYYPEVTTPVITATPGNESVALSWTAASAELAGSITQYEVGQTTTAGGAYSFTNVGNVLTSSRTSLIGGTPYYFVVRALDAQSNAIGTSAEVSATPVATAGTSGGGGGGVSFITTGIAFSGRAYPRTKIMVLQDGQRIASTTAGPDAQFSITVSGLSAGSYTFAVLAEDRSGIRSTLMTFPVELTRGATTVIGGIFIAPSTSVDKQEVRRGETVIVFGQSAPQADITLRVNSETELFAKTKTDKDGIYAYALDTSPLEIGSHTARAKSSLADAVSPFGVAAVFSVSKKSKARTAEAATICAPVKGDFNGDCRVNIIDFSILAYWHDRPTPATRTDINGDGIVNLKDFSILAFYWSG